MKKDSTFLMMVLMIFGLAPFASAQLKQTLSPNTQMSVNFGDNTGLIDRYLFVPDPDAKNHGAFNGEAGYGMFTIYRREQNGRYERWSLLQPDTSRGKGRFSTRYAYAWNWNHSSIVLVSSAPNELIPGSSQRGAVYFYLIGRNGGLRLIRKEVSTGDVEITTNGRNIVTYDKVSKRLTLFELTSNDQIINRRSTSTFSRTITKLQGMTSEGVVVYEDASGVGLMSTRHNEFYKLSTAKMALGNFSQWGGKACVKNNRIVFSVYSIYSSGNKSGYLREVRMKGDAIDTVKDFYFPLNLSYNDARVDGHHREINDISLRDSFLIVSFRQKNSNFRSRVALVDVQKEEFTIVDVLENHVWGNSSGKNWGNSIALNHDEVIVADPERREIQVYNMVYNFFQRRNGVSVYTNAFPEQYDGTGLQVAMNGSLALVAQPFSSDIEEGAGAVALCNVYQGSSVAGFNKKLYSMISARNELFGTSVALSDRFAAIGAPGHNSNQGAVHIFEVDTTLRTDDLKFSQVILSPETIVGNNFGTAVATDGDLLAVTAYGERSRGGYSGIVYVFRRSGSSWRFIQKITSPENRSFSEFGASIRLKGNDLIIGSPKESNHLGHLAGAVYCYQMVSGSFTLRQKLLPSQTGDYLYFGEYVDLHAHKLAISGNLPRDPGGSVSEYRRYSNSWSRYATYTKFGDKGYGFGKGIAIGNDDLLIGVPGSGEVQRHYKDTSTVGSFKVAGDGWNPLSLSLRGKMAVLGDYSNNRTYYGMAYFYPLTTPVSLRREATVDLDNAIFSTTGNEAALYPNPVSGGRVQLLNVNDVTRVEAYSVDGTPMGALPMRQDELDISGLRAGMYMLHVQTGNGVKVLKLSVN